MAETQKDRIMKYLHVSSEEADEILAYDKAIDRAKSGDRLAHDLSPELEKFAKKFANVTEHKKPTVYNFGQRERKANTTKEGIISTLKSFLDNEKYSNVAITNKSRQIAFRVGDKDYELTLVEKRAKK